MTILKKILLGVGVFFALLLIIPIFTQKDYAIEREIIIEKSVADVFDYIVFLKNQDHFSVWAKRDPKMKKTFTGVDGQVGFVSSWDSEDEHVGQGEQEIKKIVKNQRIDTELRFKKPFEATDNAYMITEMITANTTKVRWGFEGRMDYPMNIMLLFMNMEEMLGQDLQQGLDQLKSVLEAMPSVEKNHEEHEDDQAYFSEEGDAKTEA